MKKLSFVMAVLAGILFVGGAAAKPAPAEALPAENAQPSGQWGRSLEEPSALQAQAGGAWYRDEYGRLFSAYEPRHNVVRMGLIRGEPPTWILAADQDALGLTDAALERVGYEAAGGGNWQLQPGNLALLGE